MQNIKPISDVRNSDEIGLNREEYTSFSKLKKAEERAEKEGWIDSADLERELEIGELIQRIE